MAIQGPYTMMFENTVGSSPRFTQAYVPEESLLPEDTDDKKGGYETQESMTETPEDSVDLGGLGGFLGGSTGTGKVAGMLGKAALGSTAGTAIKSAVDAGMNFSKTGDITSMVGPAVQGVVGFLSNTLGKPISATFNAFRGTVDDVKRGMSPADAMLGNFADIGLDLGLGFLGTAIAGPIGGIVGALAGSAIDVSEYFDGLMSGMDKWGREAQTTADLTAKSFSDMLGLTDLFGGTTFEDMGITPDDVKEHMSYGGYSDVYGAMADMMSADEQTSTTVADTGWGWGTGEEESFLEDDPDPEGWGLEGEGGESGGSEGTGSGRGDTDSSPGGIGGV